MVSWKSNEEMFHEGKRKTRPNAGARLLRKIER